MALLFIAFNILILTTSSISCGDGINGSPPQSCTASSMDCLGFEQCASDTLTCSISQECSITCSVGTKSCFGTTIHASNSNGLTLICDEHSNTNEGCKQANIYAPVNKPLDITCNGGQYSCTGLIVNGTVSSATDIVCSGYNSCLGGVEIWCGSNTCDVECSGGQACIGLKLYCATSDCTINCGSDTQNPCLSVVVDASYAAAFQCSGSVTNCQHVFNNLLPTAPTYSNTNSPTTAMPTTSIPTPIQPTTNIATTAVSTTVSTTNVPTTNNPTTFMPSTTALTTNIMTTTFPTTTLPTTMFPTTKNLTTPALTNLGPPTSKPTNNLTQTPSDNPTKNPTTPGPTHPYTQLCGGGHTGDYHDNPVLVELYVEHESAVIFDCSQSLFTVGHIRADDDAGLIDQINSNVLTLPNQRANKIIEFTFTADAPTISTYTFTVNCPTKSPTEKPTYVPSKKPTIDPSQKPTGSPSKTTTENPTENPTQKPTSSPSENLPETPTKKPSVNPIIPPTRPPLNNTINPTKTPLSIRTNNIIECIGEQTCFNEANICPPNTWCHITCDGTSEGQQACYKSNIDGSLATNVTLDCIHKQDCYDTKLTCGIGICVINCHGNTDPSHVEQCKFTKVDCGQSDCKIYCNGVQSCRDSKFDLNNAISFECFGNCPSSYPSPTHALTINASNHPSTNHTPAPTDNPTYEMSKEQLVSSTVNEYNQHLGSNTNISNEWIYILISVPAVLTVVICIFVAIWKRHKLFVKSHAYKNKAIQLNKAYQVVYNNNNLNPNDDDIVNIINGTKEINIEDSDNDMSIEDMYTSNKLLPTKGLDAKKNDNNGENIEGNSDISEDFYDVNQFNTTAGDFAINNKENEHSSSDKGEQMFIQSSDNQTLTPGNETTEGNM